MATKDEKAAAIINFHLPPLMKKSLDDYADREMTSTNEMLRRIVRERLEKVHRKPEK